MKKKNLQIVWFKRDLRIADHNPLLAAAAVGRVLPLYIVEPEYWAEPDTSGRQWCFIRDSLLELRIALARIGQPLVVRLGDVVQILTGLHTHFGLGGMWSHEETGNAWTFARDRRVASWCRTAGVLWTEFPQNGVIRGLSDRNGWARKWEHFMTAKLGKEASPLAPIPRLDPGPIPEAHSFGLDDDYCPQRQRGGRSAGIERLDSFLDERGRRYRFEMSSPITAETACSRLSPHAAYGTLSLREIYHATEQRRTILKNSLTASTQPWSQSLSSFAGRLHWHCHFMQKLENQVDLEWENIHRAYDHLRADDAQLFKSWCHGETGWPFVDACMRMLHATGWINFRMRAMLMAVASYHLWINWRKPGEYLARHFTDYEPGIHWPQVQMQSGTTGINLPRIYNPIKQAHEQDPSGIFVRRWVPELCEVPDEYVHEPWAWDAAPQWLGDRYPRPIVDYLKAAKLARQRIWAVRKKDNFQNIADSIQAKHGSRKRTRQKPKPRLKRSNVNKSDRKLKAEQLNLFDPSEVLPTVDP